MKGAVLVACGVGREARIAQSGGGVVAVAGGGDGDWLAERLDALVREGAAGVMSFGLCGALEPRLRVRDVVVADGVLGDTTADCHPAWVAALRTRIVPGPREEGGLSDRRDSSGPAFRHKAGITVWADGLLASGPARKAVLAATGAVAIDMESHIAARVAARHDLPFACLRVVSDTAADTLPSAFAVAMQRGGGTNVPALLRSLAAHPAQVPAFARASANAVRALKRLDLLSRLLGPRLGLPDLG